MAKLENLFASRFLKARKSNRLLSYLSVTSVIGVMLGVAALITVISVMDGFTENLKLKFLGSNPHIMVTHMNASPIPNWEDRAKEIEHIKHVKSVTPLILGQAMISNDRKVTGVLVRGIEPSLETGSALEKSVMTGSLSELVASSEGQMPSIFVGKDLTISVGALPGRELTLISPTTTRSAFGVVPKMRKYKVAGYFDAGMYQHNNTLVYLDLKEAQDFLMMGDSVTAITVTLDDPNRATEVAHSVQEALNSKFDDDAPRGTFFWARDWLSLNSNIFEALKLEQYALFVILTLIIIVASFTIVSMITVTVKDKKKEIAIIRAMGGSEKLIRKIFVRQGVMIGFTGTLLGNIMALIIAFILKNFKIVEIPKEIYFSDTIPIKLSLSIFVIVTVCSFIITYVAAALPSGISAKVSPLDAIRND